MDKWSGGVRGDPRDDAANNPGGQHAYASSTEDEARQYEQELDIEAARGEPSWVERVKGWLRRF